MSGVYVVDTSIAVKWFVPEEHTDIAYRFLLQGHDLLAPDLIWAEFGNVLWRKWRLGELSLEAVESLLAQFRRFPLHIHSGESLYGVAWAAASETGRTFYDSLYLALAVTTGCQVVTADRRFYNAVRTTPWGRHCLWVEDLP